MPETGTPKEKRPLFAGLRQEWAQLGADLRESLELRWQLALIELKADARSVGRLAGWLAAAAVLGLVGLPLLLVWAADRLALWFNSGRDVWLLGLGLGLLALALLVGLLAWRSFRRRFLGLEQTLEELREDLQWLRDWTARAEKPTE